MRLTRFAWRAALCWCLQAILAAAGASRASAETGYAAWLRYSAIEPEQKDRYNAVPRRVLLLGDSVVLKTARDEAIRGLTSMLGEPVTA